MTRHGTVYDRPKDGVEEGKGDGMPECQAGFWEAKGLEAKSEDREFHDVTGMQGIGKATC